MTNNEVLVAFLIGSLYIDIKAGTIINPPPAPIDADKKPTRKDCMRYFKLNVD